MLFDIAILFVNQQNVNEKLQRIQGYISYNSILLTESEKEYNKTIIIHDKNASTSFLWE